MKWKRLVATQPRSGRPHKLIELDRRVLNRVTNRLSSVTTLTTEFQATSGSNISTINVHGELHEIGFHDRAATLSSSGVKPSASGNMFSGVMNYPSPSGSPTDESGFGGCQENATCPNA